jgi:MoaA/NifB/PqqE/SkfB family radical SAM enzyme
MQLIHKSKVLQIHPTRQCNLRCQHCYSNSSPDIKASLPISLLLDTVTDAAAIGYNVISISGGEPLLYPALGELLQHAHSQNCLTTITTNGMLLSQPNLEKLQGNVDLIAISLDGLPASHNHNRGANNAFEMMQSRLAGLRQSGIPFGFIFTLTQYNLTELEWVAQFAYEQGAKLLQIHPLELAGRAVEHLPGEDPDSLEMSIAYLEAARLQQCFGTEMFIQVDLVSQSALNANSAIFKTNLDSKDIQLSDVLSPLVLETSGMVVPLQYGLSHQFAIGNIYEARLASLADAWLKHRLSQFQNLCAKALESISTQTDTKVLNLYDLIGQAAQQTVAEQTVTVV